MTILRTAIEDNEVTVLVPDDVDDAEVERILREKLAVTGAAIVNDATPEGLELPTHRIKDGDVLELNDVWVDRWNMLEIVDERTVPTTDVLPRPRGRECGLRGRVWAPTTTRRRP